jgi:hypothetical protein
MTGRLSPVNDDSSKEALGDRSVASIGTISPDLTSTESPILTSLAATSSIVVDPGTSR